MDQSLREKNFLDCLSGPDALKLLEIINDTLTCSSERELENIVNRKLRDLLDFQYATYLSARRLQSWTIAPLNIEYPLEFLDQYARNGFAAQDPIFQAALTDPGVNYWSDLTQKYPFHKKLESLAADFGLIQGYQWGLRNFYGDCFGTFSICGTIIGRSPRTEAILELLIPHIHQSYKRLRRDRKRKRSPLTPREAEVLNWVKDGKTSWDIATILSISERTVRFHLKNIMSKLNAMSRTHAVAIALEEGLIENF